MALRTPIPRPSNINQGLHVTTERVLAGYFGYPRPRDTITDSTQLPSNPDFLPFTTLPRQASVTIGGIRVRWGLQLAVTSLREVVDDIRVLEPQVYDVLSNGSPNSMGSVRRARGGEINAPGVSNHSWGTAIDLTIEGALQPRRVDEPWEGYARIAPIFASHGWFWGMGFRTTDPHHFLVSPELLAAWRDAGHIGDQHATGDGRRIEGDNQSESLSGGIGDEILVGKGGDDTVKGGGGNDTIFGDTISLDSLISGDDLLNGNNGDDDLSGGPGNDTLDGDAGNDLLTGGPGTDTYIVAANEGKDTIIGSDDSAEDQDIVIVEGRGIIQSADGLHFVRDGINLRVYFLDEHGLLHGSVTFFDMDDPSAPKTLRLLDSGGVQIGGDIDLAEKWGELERRGDSPWMRALHNTKELSPGQNLSLEDLFLATDPDGDVLSSWALHDGNNALGSTHFHVNQPFTAFDPETGASTSHDPGEAPGGQLILVDNFSSGAVEVRPGQSRGQDDLFAAASDGSVWSNWALIEIEVRA